MNGINIDKEAMLFKPKAGMKVLATLYERPTDWTTKGKTVIGVLQGKTSDAVLHPRNPMWELSQTDVNSQPISKVYENTIKVQLEVEYSYRNRQGRNRSTPTKTKFFVGDAMELWGQLRSLVGEKGSRIVIHNVEPVWGHRP